MFVKNVMINLKKYSIEEITAFDKKTIVDITDDVVRELTEKNNCNKDRSEIKTFREDYSANLL